MKGIGRKPEKEVESRERCGGFTLLEVMVALSILAVAFTVLLGLRNRDIVQHDEAQYITRATLLAGQKLSEQEMAGFPSLGFSSGDFPEPDDDLTWTQTVDSTLFEFAREVKVEVNWKERARKNPVELITYMVDEGP